jgi:2-oxo-4-hydroxy-4-carboxy-5-ureidoimidazoline decarboxylase
VTIAEANALEREGFVAAVGWVCEHSPWVAERAWDGRPFADVDGLHGALVGEIARATTDEQLALLRAHPDLGARLGPRPSGVGATDVRMSDASAAEQAGAGLDRLAAHEHARLQELNAAYRAKFGFPFLYAVKGSTPRDILASLAERLDRAPDEEFAEALHQVTRIVRFRLEDIFRT